MTSLNDLQSKFFELHRKFFEKKLTLDFALAAFTERKLNKLSLNEF
jgi:hypothetical protein